MKRKGITLIELMLVITILSILSSIAIVRYDIYVIKARRHNAIGAGLEIYNSVMWLYKEENKDWSRFGIITRVKEVADIDLDNVEFVNDTINQLKLRYKHESKYYSLVVDLANLSYKVIEIGSNIIVYP